MKRSPFKEPSKASWTTGGSCLEVCKLACKFLHYRKLFPWEREIGKKRREISWQESSGSLPTRTSHFYCKGKKNAIQCLPLPLKTLILAAGGSLPQLGVSRSLLKSSLVCCILTEIAERCVVSVCFSFYLPLWKECAEPPGQTEVLYHRRMLHIVSRKTQARQQISSWVSITNVAMQTICAV